LPLLLLVEEEVEDEDVDEELEEVDDFCPLLPFLVKLERNLSPDGLIVISQYHEP
jgi:hypothetical protein